jgi:hypothetical protein
MRRPAILDRSASPAVGLADGAGVSDGDGDGDGDGVGAELGRTSGVALAPSRPAQAASNPDIAARAAARSTARRDRRSWSRTSS